MQLFGSLTAFKNMLSSVATSIGSAGTNTGSTASAAVTLQSGDATGGTSNSGALILATGTATSDSGALTIKTGLAPAGTRGLLTLDSAALALLCPTITMSATAGLTAATSLTLTSAAITLAGPITLPAVASIGASTSLTITSASSGFKLSQNAGTNVTSIAVPATTGTVTLPATGTLATLDGAETLTNKIVRGFGLAPIHSVSPTYATADLVASSNGLNIYTALQASTNKAPASEPTYWQPIILTGLGTITDNNTTNPKCDGQTGRTFSATLSGNGTILVDHMQDGEAYNVYVSGAAARTILWDTKDKDSIALTEKYGITYSGTMTNGLSLFTLLRIGTTVIVNSLHGIA